MAICEVCGLDQFPFNTKVTIGKDGKRHFFCSFQHLKSWDAAGELAPAEIPGQISAEEAMQECAETPSAAAAVLAHHKVEEEIASEAGRLLEEAGEVGGPFFCGICGKEAKSLAGLGAHTRAKHTK